jgi:hypothetical protein
VRRFVAHLSSIASASHKKCFCTPTIHIIQPSKGKPSHSILSLDCFSEEAQCKSVAATENGSSFAICSDDDPK